MGIFLAETNQWEHYRTRLQFRDRLMGGIPKDPKIIQNWLKSRAGIEKAEELHRAVVRTLRELGAELPEHATIEEIEAAAEVFAGERNCNGFYRDPERGLYIAARIVKAMIKENTNATLTQPGNEGRRGPTKKGVKSWVAENVFVAPYAIFLDRMEPDGVELQIVHVTGPQGPKSSLTYVEYVERASITLYIKAWRDRVSHEDWVEIWNHAEESGLGAARSQEYGKFDVVEWERVNPEEVATAEREQAPYLARIARQEREANAFADTVVARV